MQLGHLRFGFSIGSLSPPPPPPPSADLSCLPVRLGRNSPDSSGVRQLVLGGVLGPYQLPQTQGSVPGPEVSRGSCLRSVSSGSFGQRNSRVLYQVFREVFLSPPLCLVALELRPPSIFNFPSIVPVAGFHRLGRWTHSPSGGQVFHYTPSHLFLVCLVH